MFLALIKLCHTVKQLNKIEGWIRDGNAKKYTNKICRIWIHLPSLKMTNFEFMIQKLDVSLDTT